MKKRKKIPAHKKKAANPPRKVTLRQLPTGVRGLDEILGGGLPEYSFNIIAGGPGCGKTTLAHQILFANTSVKNRALYFTVVGESALKMLRYQQQYTFFDPAKVNGAIRFINLSDVMLEKDLGCVFDEIVREVQATNPALVVVDSFRTLVRKALGASSETELQGFVQRLALFLTSWQATTFLVGEYSDIEMRDNPVFTVADGLFWLSQVAERNSVVRKVQITKLRGQESVPGLHTVRITNDGVQAFSRTLGLTGKKARPIRRRRSRRRQPARGRTFGHGKIRAGHSIPRRRSAPGRTGHRSHLRRAPARLHGAGRQFWASSGCGAENRKARTALLASAGPLGG